MISTKASRILAFAGIAVLVLILVAVYRRLRPAAAQTPYIQQAAATLGMLLGLAAFLAGIGHTVAVMSLALREEYVTLTALRFTTGAMLMYAGAANLVLYRSIRAGRPSAIATNLASCLLFVTYLLFLFPLRGTGGTVPPMLGLWSVYLAVLGAAALRLGKPDSSKGGIPL